MNLEGYIVKLLYTNDCVIVPGFGAFIGQKTDAVYRQEDSVFLPPAKHILFNPSLKDDDGILTGEVAKTEKLSFEEAKKEVENAVGFWQNHLSVNPSLVLPGLGMLTKDKEGLMGFAPNHGNLLAEAFGLERIRAEYIFKPAAARPPKSVTLWKAAALIPFLLGGFLYFAKPQPVSDFVNKQWSGWVTPMMSPAPQTAVIAVEAPVAVIEEKVEELKAFVPVTHDYQVISGAFTKEEEADAQVGILQSKGFENARMTQKKGRFYYVAFETFETKEEALSYSDTIKDDFPKTWVFSLKE